MNINAKANGGIPWVSVGLGLILVLCAGLPFGHAAPTLEDCPVFPQDNVWNTPVDQLPVHPSSATFVQVIGADTSLHPDFGAGLWDGGPIGIPFDVVSGDQQTSSVAFDYSDESDPGPYPIPEDPSIEGGADSDGDRHVLILDRDACMLYELYAAYPQPDGSWVAGSGAIFDLYSNQLRPDGWTSADAAGLPILPGLIRYEEIEAGEIQHAIRFTAPQTRRAYLWPARHYASSLTGEQYPPMGLRLRLKSDFDVSGFSAEVRIILEALKKYGMILADNGSPWYLSGVPDERWDNETLVDELRMVKGSDFEVVDESSLMVDPDSGQALSSTATLNPNPPTESTKLIFIHHSTGENWLADGDGRLGINLRDNNYYVSDTNYGWGPNGIGDTTDIGHWWNWFRSAASPTYMTALYQESDQHSAYSRLSVDPGGENEIVLFKSCFPNSHLGGNPTDPPAGAVNPLRGQDAGSSFHTVGNAKGIYNDILEYFATRQDKLFVVITAPPLSAAETDSGAAANARALNDWLVNDWLSDYPYHNVAVFDFYNVLTSNGGNAYINDLGDTDGNHHRFLAGLVQHQQTLDQDTSAYPTGAWDSHPTQAGNRKASGEFPQVLNIYYHCWQGDGGCPNQTPAVAAAFSADPLTGSAPLTVDFTDQSSGTITSWNWDFGDGTQSTEQDPSHTYQVEGDFTVSLTVAGPDGSDTETKTELIHVSSGDDPVVQIQAYGQSGSVSIPEGLPVLITIRLEPGDHAGQWADWWISLATASAQFSFVYSHGWVPGEHRAFPAPLVDVGPLPIFFRALPPGEYHFGFAVDDNVDNNKDATWSNTVTVTVTSSE